MPSSITNKHAHSFRPKHYDDAGDLVLECTAKTCDFEITVSEVARNHTTEEIILDSVRDALQAEMDKLKCEQMRRRWHE